MMTNKPIRFFIFTLLMLLAPAAMADNSRSVTVQESGYVEAVPDTLHLQLTVTEIADSLDIARQAADKTVVEVLAIAQRIGIEAGDIDSARISAYPQYEWRADKRHYLGEAVTRHINITLRNLDRYGRLISQLTKLPLEGIGSPRMSHSNMEELRLTALKDALAKSQRKAQVIAEQLKVKLGRVLSVQDESVSRPQPYLLRTGAGAGVPQPSDDGSSFSYAKQRITATVQIQFEIE